MARLRFYNVRSFLFGFMLGFPVVITSKLIRRHNLCYRGWVALWSLGVLAVFLFVWVLASLSVGHRSLTLSILIFCILGGIGAFVFGHYHLKKKDGPQDWERNAQKSDMKPGVHLARMSSQEYGKIEHGLCALILAGLGWIDQKF